MRYSGIYGETSFSDYQSTKFHECKIITIFSTWEFLVKHHFLIIKTQTSVNSKNQNLFFVFLFSS